MNERGLAVGMMAVDHSEGELDPRNGTLDSLQLIRLLLDYAGTVEEALDLMHKYNVDFGQGPAIHYLIADAEGDSVIVEYLNGKLRMIHSRVPWQISTNFLFSETPIEAAHSACWRYETADLALSSTAGIVTPQEAMAILERVSQTGTIWSLIYNQTSGQILVSTGRDFQKTYPFQLEK
jgi:choloylglycine hydrolase